MVKLLPSFLLVLIFTGFSFGQAIDDRTETNCNGEMRNVYEVAAEGIPIIVASKGFDCSICVSQADEVAEFASENAWSIQVWGAMKYTYSSATPDCDDVNNWVITHNWDNVFTFPDPDGYWASFGTPYYQVIDPLTLEIAYDGPNFTNATNIAQSLTTLRTSNIIRKDGIMLSANGENLFIQFSASEGSKAVVEVFDIVGRQVGEYPLTIIPGSNTFTIPFDENYGIYLANIHLDGQSISTKFINRN